MLLSGPKPGLLEALEGQGAEKEEEKYDVAFFFFLQVLGPDDGYLRLWE